MIVAEEIVLMAVLDQLETWLVDKKPVLVRADLTEPQAMALAQFVKRAGFNDVQRLATNNDEAYEMLSALRVIQSSLADEGYAPR